MSDSALELEAVSFSYGEGPVLSGVDLRVGAGEVVALVGSSGAGKSTLLDLANGTLTPDAGAVRIAGTDLAGLRGRARRSLLSGVGTVPQHVPLPGNLRVIHNVNSGRLGSWSTSQSFGSLVSPKGVDEARRALDRLGIGDLIDARTDSLSGGQRQRVALARVLVAQPRIVLADEPVSAVDPAWSKEVIGAICELASGGHSAALISLHDPGLALAGCSRLIALVEGRVVVDSPTASLGRADLDEIYRLARDDAPT